MIDIFSKFLYYYTQIYRFRNSDDKMALKISQPHAKQFERPLTQDIQQQFLSFMIENGMELDPNKGLVTNGSIGRAYVNLGGKRKLSGWYQLWMDQ